MRNVSVFRARATLAILSSITLFTLGCGQSGPAVVPVSGKVVIDGKPLAHGYIRFVPEQGRASDAQLASDGTFSLRYSAERMGAVPGLHRVEVAANEVISTSRVKWHAPKTYASLGTSDLTQNIEGPTDDIVIELTWGSASGPFEDVFKADSSF
jgi:hypothetical protein